MKLIFISNYLNHHQIPFCDSLYRKLDGDFAFLQTQPMEQERVIMGWKNGTDKPYLKLFYENPGECRKMILESDMVLFGGVEDESYISERLAAKKPVIRYCERMYKTGQWKAVSPRGLLKKYKDHTRYRNSDVYLLCAGAYVASDYGIIRAYPGKMFCWGYFPETKRYDVDDLMKNKGYREPAHSAQNGGTCEDAPEKILYILWAGRFIDWKHPELAVETAEYLKDKGVSFHMDIIGGGELDSQVRNLALSKNLTDCVTFLGFLEPSKVREHMEKADILLFTSDREEGWGAVANEAMNSGCAVIADHMIGSVPYLIRHGENGLIYKDGRKNELFDYAYRLSRDRELRQKLGKNAYETIVTDWNAENAASQLLSLIRKIEDHTLPKHTRKADKPYPGAPETPSRESKVCKK